jgi:hypothetical protein
MSHAATEQRDGSEGCEGCANPAAQGVETTRREPSAIGRREVNPWHFIWFLPSSRLRKVLFLPGSEASLQRGLAAGGGVGARERCPLVG